MKKGLALLAAGSAVAFALPAVAQENAAFTGPRVEALVGYDSSSPGSSEDIDNAEDIDQSMDGVAYGVGIGYDFAFSGVLVGVEGEWLETDSGRDLYAGVRVGTLVTPQTLLYAKGGYTNARYNVAGIDSTTGTRVDTDTNLDLDGWRIGAGVEHAITPNVFGKLEYRYSNYEEGEVQAPTGAESARFDIDSDRHQVMAGVGYRF
jgi:outer membrane immunogenic protein